MSEIYSVFVIALAAVLAPLLGRLPLLLQTPVVVLELALGILIGPSGANWVASDSTIGFLGIFGLAFLFFQAGLEFQRDKISAKALRLGALAWLASLGLACLFVLLLHLVGLLRAPLLVALVLPTTAFGILIPILHQTGDIDSDFGRYLLGAAAVGELGPVLLASVALAHANHHLQQTLLSTAFLAIAVGSIILARTMSSNGLSAKIARWMGDGSILPIRIAILILLGLVSLASELGMEIVLGAYAAGVVVALLARGSEADALLARLNAIGSGVFIPMFFIISGVEFDLIGLVTSPASLLRLILFSMALLFIQIIPIRLYKGALPERDLLPLALLFLHHAWPRRRGDLSRRADRPDVERKRLGPCRRGGDFGGGFSDPRHFASGAIRPRARRRVPGDPRPTRQRFHDCAAGAIQGLYFPEGLRVDDALRSGVDEIRAIKSGVKDMRAHEDRALFLRRLAPQYEPCAQRDQRRAYNQRQAPLRKLHRRQQAEDADLALGERRPDAAVRIDKSDDLLGRQPVIIVKMHVGSRAQFLDRALVDFAGEPGPTRPDEREQAGDAEGAGHDFQKA